MEMKMIKVESCDIKERFNLVDDSIPNHDEDRYIRQLSLEEVKRLGISIIKLLK